MSLRIADPAGLIAFLRQVIEEDYEVIHDLAPHRIVRSRGRVFSIHDDPRLLSGPFPSDGALIESDGLREEDGSYFWHGHRFVVEGDEAWAVDP